MQVIWCLTSENTAACTNPMQPLLKILIRNVFLPNPIGIS